MKKRIVGLVLATAVSFGACKTLGVGEPDQATRILADINCVTTALAAGMAIAGDPAVNGAKTALSVLTAIMTVGTSNVPANVLAACKDTLAYVSQDAAGALAIVKNSDGTTAPKIPPPTPMAPGARVAAQPKTPTPVVIPLKKK